MPRKARRTISKKTPRRLPKLPVDRFSQIVRSSWNKTIRPLRGAKIPAEVRRLPVARDLTLGSAALLGLLALAAILLFFFGNNLVHAWQTRTAAAIVNGEVIGKGTLERRLIQSYGDDTVQRLVDEALIFQAAKKENIILTQTEINNELAKVEADIAPSKLDDELAARKMDRSDLDRQIRLKLITEKILGQGVNPSDKEIEDYFNANRDVLAQAKAVKPEDLKLEDVREQVLETLIQQTISSKYQDWIDGLRASAKIETFVSP